MIHARDGETCLRVVTGKGDKSSDSKSCESDGIDDILSVGIHGMHFS